MTLPSSGAISLSQINTELIRGVTDTISLNDTAVRRLAQALTTGTTITSPTDFWGKAANFLGTLTTSVAQDYGYSICQDNNGNLFATGSTRSIGSSASDHFYIAKFNSNGVLQWQRGLYSARYDIGAAVVTNANGDVYAAGYTNGINVNKYDIFIVKYNASGTLQWQRRYGNADTTLNASSMALDASGNVYIGGYRVSSVNNQAYALLLKVDSAGSLQWNYTYGNSLGDYIKDLKIVNNNLYVTGTTTTSGAGYTNALIAKLDLAGNLQWAKQLTAGGSSQNTGSTLAVDASENIYVGGAISFASYEGLIAKLNSSGALIWATGVRRNLEDVYNPAVAITSTGNMLISFQQSYPVSSIMQIDSSGARVWENRLTGIYRRGVANINDSLCLFGYYGDTAPQLSLAVLPKNGTGLGTYGPLYYESGYDSSVYTPTTTVSALSIATQSTSTTFSVGSMTEATPPATYTKYNI